MSDIARYLGTNDDGLDRRNKKELANALSGYLQEARTNVYKAAIDAEQTVRVMGTEIDALNEMKRMAGDDPHFQQLAARRWTQMVSNNDSRLSGKKPLL